MSLIFEGILLCIGLYWLITATTTLPLWKGTSLAGGLLPTIVSAIMILLLLFRIISQLRSGEFTKERFKETFKEFNWKCMVPLGIGILVVVGTKLIGLFISLTIMLFCWLKFLSGYGWKKSLLVTICVMAVLYGVFKAWLVVPLHKGLLGLV